MSVMRLMDDECVVTIELKDGTVLSGTALATDVNVQAPMIDVTEFGSAESRHIAGQPTWEIAMMGVGDLMMRGEYERKVELKRTATHWTCPYCGRVHDKSRNKCWDGADGCGASRPLTGVADL